VERQVMSMYRSTTGRRGRPEAPVCPEDGPAAVLAIELRRLREEAGRPSYRDMSRLARASPSALSEAARGRRWPSWPVVAGYARACGAELGPWQARWEELRPAADRPMVAGEAPLVTEAPPCSEPAGQPAETSGRLALAWLRAWPPEWLFGAGAALLAIVATLLGVSRPSAPPVAAHPPASPAAAPASAAHGPGAPVAIRRSGTLTMAPGEVADLDSMTADWAEQPEPGPATADIWFGATDDSLHGVGNNDIAVLPPGQAGGFWPCALEQNYGVTLVAAAIRPGKILCGLTAADRVAELQVTGVHHDAGGLLDQVTFKVTVWVPRHLT
jgi:hypothetical protein